MTKEEKQLVLITLSEMLPYRVVINMDGQFDNIPSAIDVISEEVWDTMHENGYPIGQYDIKPYLRPMSSMTEEEKLMYEGLMIGTDNISYMLDVIDWLNAHHFDYRGLIEKGLAIAVTEENNPYKE